jgi:hypothetical protein
MNETIANDLHALLAHNIVYFTYRKVNGEIRHAIGTRNLTLAENYTSQYIARPLGAEQPNSYYDVEKMGWRSYKPENLISIDRVNDFDYATSEPIQQTKKGELPKREIPINKPTRNGGADIDKILGSIFGGFGMPMGEIRKSMEDLDKDIVIGAPTHSPKVGTPTATEKGIELPLNEISVEDFAKMVAHYVVEEIVSRIKG